MGLKRQEKNNKKFPFKESPLGWLLLTGDLKTSQIECVA
jgi:hypothetical protein